MNGNKTCFVICPIGTSDSDIRKDSNRLLKYIITPPVSKLGYTIERADEVDKPGSITQQIIDKLMNVDLVIADLTNHNPNVFYELAIRHGAQKPYIQMIKEGQTIPFDVGDLRTIKYDFDIEKATEAMNSLENQIKEINSENFHIYSPVTFVLNVNNSSDSKDYINFFMQEINSKLNKLLTVASENESISIIKESNIRSPNERFLKIREELRDLDRELGELSDTHCQIERDMIIAETEGDFNNSERLRDSLNKLVIQIEKVKSARDSLKMEYNNSCHFLKREQTFK